MKGPTIEETKVAIESAGGCEAIETPLPNDVLFGRGGHSNNHPGNRKYHAHLETRAWEYSRLKGRNAKTKLAWEITHQLKEEGIRFLYRDKKLGVYFEAPDDESRKKVSQRLRELALDIKEHENGNEACSEIECEGKAVPETKLGPEPDSEDDPMDETNPIDHTQAFEDSSSVLFENKKLLEKCLLSRDESDETTVPKPHETFHPDLLLSSDLQDDVSLTPDDWASDVAHCGSFDDLSDCSFKTLTPFTFPYRVAIDWPQSINQFPIMSQVANGMQQQRIPHAFAHHIPGRALQQMAPLPTQYPNRIQSQYPNLSNNTTIPQSQYPNQQQVPVHIQSQSYPTQQQNGKIPYSFNTDQFDFKVGRATKRRRRESDMSTDGEV